MLDALKVERGGGGWRLLAAILLFIAMLCFLIVHAVGESSPSSKIEQFEVDDLAYSVTVEAGTSKEDLGLPEDLRAVVSLEDTDLDASIFEQADPGDTLPDGYEASADADTLRQEGETVIYTFLSEADESSEVSEDISESENTTVAEDASESQDPVAEENVLVDYDATGEDITSDDATTLSSNSTSNENSTSDGDEVTEENATSESSDTTEDDAIEDDGSYRIYGSLDGGENAWYSCDSEGNINGVVVDVPVTWEGDYDSDEAGTYTLSASFSGYTYASARPYAVVTVEAASLSTSSSDTTTLASNSDNPYSPGEEAYYTYIWENEILPEFEWASAADMGSNVSAAWTTDNMSEPVKGTGSLTSSYDPSKSTDDYYLVTNGAELRWCIVNHVSFQLQNDIDLGGANGAEWKSIVESQDAGSGWTGSNLTILDFGNYTIYNMYVTGQYSSLLGTASNPNLYVENLNLCNFRVGSDADVASGNRRLAALCNSTGYMTIYNVHLYDGVVQGGDYVAGLINGDNGDVRSDYDVAMGTVENPATTVVNVGLERVHVYSAGHGAGFATNTWGLSIENCYSLDCTVLVPAGHSGGFVSCIRGLKANNCFTNAEVYGEDMTGVFLGMMHVGTYLVENCFAFGSIEGVEDIGGFVASTEPSNTAGYIDATFRNCYTTSIVGMEEGGSYMGGFMGVLYSSDMHERGTSTSYSYTTITFENCYAAGEVGDVDTAVDENRTTHTTVGGFIGTLTDRSGPQSEPSSATFINCYYDKQTTAMREWAVGEYLIDNASGRLADTTGANADLDITGVLTTATNKSGAGLTSGVGASGFIGFTDDGEWVFVSNDYDSYYPQVSTAYNATAEDSSRIANNVKWVSGSGWSSEEEAALVRAASAASAATVFLETWELDFDGYALPYTTYDTVRDITLSFTATSDTTESSIEWASDGATSTLYGDTLEILDVAQDDAGVWQVSTTSLGISWLEVAATDSDQVAHRSLRLIPTVNLDAGLSDVIEAGEYYDHADDVRLAYSTAQRMAEAATDITSGIYPDQETNTSPWSDTQQAIESDDSASYLASGDDLFSDVDMNAIAQGSTIVRVDIYKVQEVVDGELVDLAESVAINSAAVTIDTDWQSKWNGHNPLLIDDQGTYEITYYWVLEDGRYLQDTKSITYLAGIVSGLRWLDENGDGMQDEDFSAAADGSAQDDDLQGMTATLMRWDDDEGDYVAVIDEDGNAVVAYTFLDGTNTQDIIGWYSEQGIAATVDNDGSVFVDYSVVFTIDNLDVTLTIRVTMTPDDSGGAYEFSGLPSGAYAVQFTSDEVAMGQFVTSPQQDDNGNLTDSKADATYVDTNGNEFSEYYDPGDVPAGRWLSYATVSGIVIDITEVDDSGNTVATDLEYRVSTNNDAGFVWRTGSITITKTDESGESLNNVVFKLERLVSGDADDDDAVWVTVAEGDAAANTTSTVEGKDGMLIYTGLPCGTYRLTEIGTTSGNSLLADSIIVTIPVDDSEIIDEGEQGDEQGGSTTDPSYKFNDTSYWLDIGYNITNGSLFTLPDAGSTLPWWIWMVVGLSIVGSATAVFVGAQKYKKVKRVEHLRASLGDPI